MAYPAISIGTGLLGSGEFSNLVETEALLSRWKAGGILRIDTAARYPPMHTGLAESLLGNADAATKGFVVNSKVYTSARDGSGELTAAAIDNSVKASLERLHVDQLNLLYLHLEDPKTPLEETLGEIDRQLRLGTIKQWGVCRFSLSTLQSLLRLCEQHGYAKPSAYQGEYNVITRGIEPMLLPLLRQHSICYEAHRSLAAGFMSAKFTTGDFAGTRFAEDNPLHQYFRKDYDNLELHTIIRDLLKELEGFKISPQAAALRWALYHSALQPQDSIIIGCSSLQQVDDNIANAEGGPLPESLANFISGLWHRLEGRGREQIL